MGRCRKKIDEERDNERDKKRLLIAAFRVLPESEAILTSQ